jgi:hypothetical protein
LTSKDLLETISLSCDFLMDTRRLSGILVPMLILTISTSRDPQESILLVYD